MTQQTTTSKPRSQQVQTKVGHLELLKRTARKKPVTIKQIQRYEMSLIISEVMDLLIQKALDGYEVAIPGIGTLHVHETKIPMSQVKRINWSWSFRHWKEGGKGYIYHQQNSLDSYMHLLKWRRDYYKGPWRALYKFKPQPSFLTEMYDRVKKGKIY